VGDGRSFYGGTSLRYPECNLVTKKVRVTKKEPGVETLPKIGKGRLGTSVGGGGGGGGGGYRCSKKGRCNINPLGEEGK